MHKQSMANLDLHMEYYLIDDCFHTCANNCIFQDKDISH